MKRTHKKSSKGSKLAFWKKSPKQKKSQPEVSADGEPSAPRITSDTVAEHREEVLAGARRFIYPLQQSRHRVVIISSIIIVLVLLSSLLFSSLLLYRYQSTSSFAYRVSQLVPFPVTKIDNEYVAYENYLFELNYALFYYETYDQEGVDINSSEGEAIQDQLKKDALTKVKLDTVAKTIAAENGIKITDQQIDEQIEFIRNQGGIGSSDDVLNDILESSYNWDINDLRRTIRLQLTRQSLPRLLDTETNADAEAAVQELADGEKFGDVAKKYSDDEVTKDQNGLIGDVTQTDSILPPEFINAVYSLEEGEVSELIESRFGLHIIKVNEIKEDGVRNVSHILLTYFNIEEFLTNELEKKEVNDYIDIE